MPRHPYDVYRASLTRRAALLRRLWWRPLFRVYKALPLPATLQWRWRGAYARLASRAYY